MAATTITRDTWTNDTGTAANPNLDGTVINNAALQNNIYARIDEMFSGGGSYTQFRFGGTVAVEGVGASAVTIVGSVTGANTLTVQNSLAGTGNLGRVAVGNDSSSTLTMLQSLASTFTPTSVNLANGTTLQGSGAGGVSVAAVDSSGTLRFFAGGTTERARFGTAGAMYINDTANAGMTIGLTINQGTATNESLALKNTDVAHGMTTFAETDTYGRCYSAAGTSGGLAIESLSETNYSLYLQGKVTSADTTKSTAALGPVLLDTGLKSGTTAVSVGANGNLVVVRDFGTARFILDADGDSHQDIGTAWTNFDDHEDVELLHALSAGVSRKGDPLRKAFGRFLTKHRHTLEHTGLVTFNEDGHHFINWSRTHMLTIGAVRQQAERLALMERRLKALEA